MVKKAIEDKKNEFTAYQTQVTAYNTLKTAYEGVMKKIAEANARRERDYFTKILPSKED